jgi:hypothetical protein
MPLRAEAPAFIPKICMRNAGMQTSRGDQLIQELAGAIEPRKTSVCEFVQQAGSERAGMQRSRGDQLIHELAEAIEPRKNHAVAIETRKTHVLSTYPAAGIFCPYCVAGGACAFHKAAETPRGKDNVLNVRCQKLESVSEAPNHPMRQIAHKAAESKLLQPDSTAHMFFNRAACGRPACAFDASSDSLDCEEASTDVSSSDDRWCEASNGSDSPSARSQAKNAWALPWDAQSGLWSKINTSGRIIKG